MDSTKASSQRIEVIHMALISNVVLVLTQLPKPIVIGILVVTFLVERVNNYISRY